MYIEFVLVFDTGMFLNVTSSLFQMPLKLNRNRAAENLILTTSLYNKSQDPRSVKRLLPV